MAVKVGCVHGRFQVFHNDHLRYVEAALDRCERLLIGITSPELNNLVAQDSDLARAAPLNNPMTFYERMNAIRLVLVGQGVDRSQFDVIPFPIESPERLSNYAPQLAIHLLTIYDDWGEEKLRRLLDQGFSVEVLWRTQSKGISGRMVRHAMQMGEEWKCDVPAEAVVYYDEIGLVDRLRQLADV